MEIKFSQNEINSFLKQGGDRNPIHHNHDFTKLTPLGTNIAPGLYLIEKILSTVKINSSDIVQIKIDFLFPIIELSWRYQISTSSAANETKVSLMKGEKVYLTAQVIFDKKPQHEKINFSKLSHASTSFTEIPTAIMHLTLTRSDSNELEVLNKLGVDYLEASKSITDTRVQFLLKKIRPYQEPQLHSTKLRGQIKPTLVIGASRGIGFHLEQILLKSQIRSVTLDSITFQVESPTLIKEEFENIVFCPFPTYEEIDISNLNTYELTEIENMISPYIECLNWLRIQYPDKNLINLSSSFVETHPNLLMAFLKSKLEKACPDIKHVRLPPYMGRRNHGLTSRLKEESILNALELIIAELK